MNDALKNPFIVFIAGLIGIWLVFKVLKIVVNMGGIITLVFALMFIFHPPFRTKVQQFLSGIFR